MMEQIYFLRHTDFSWALGSRVFQPPSAVYQQGQMRPQLHPQLIFFQVSSAGQNISSSVLMVGYSPLSRDLYSPAIMGPWEMTASSQEQKIQQLNSPIREDLLDYRQRAFYNHPMSITSDNAEQRSSA
jgi:hypothetical protein